MADADGMMHNTMQGRKKKKKKKNKSENKKINKKYTALLRQGLWLVPRTMDLVVRFPVTLRRVDSEFSRSRGKK